MVYDSVGTGRDLSARIVIGNQGSMIHHEQLLYCALILAIEHTRMVYAAADKSQLAGIYFTIFE
jgi:hypothetical protein